jgi:nucleotide-binding universal stress UspA family protein
VKVFNKLAVAVDLSPFSQNIIACAGKLSERSGAEVVVVSVIDKRMIDGVESAFEAEGRGFSYKRFLADETFRRTQSLRELFEQALPSHVPRKMIITSGVPATEVLKVVNQEQAELLIIGTKGVTNLRGFRRGTTAERLYRYCPVSVLSVSHQP